MKWAFMRTLTELAAQDPRVTLVVGDLGFGVVLDFARSHPRQFLNAGVAEQNMTGLAAGLALCGKIVFTYSIANFPTLRCLEQIRNDICYHQANVKIVALGGGYAYGALGMSHHATEDLAILRTLPHMTVIAPGDLAETEAAVRAITKLSGPCYLRLGRAAEPTLHEGPIAFQVGKALTVREGTDATLISTGCMLSTALKVAVRLETKGVKVRVLSMHTLKPLDTAAVLAAARETGMVFTLEEHSILGGLGGAVAEVLAESGLSRIRFKRLGLPSAFTKQVGDQGYLCKLHDLDEEGVFRSVQKALDETGDTRKVNHERRPSPEKVEW